MVGETRHNHEQPSGSQDPPQNPMEAFATTATELLRQIVQVQQQHNAHIPEAAHYQAFLATQPPALEPTDEPLDADAWIRIIESKFAILSLPCSEENKVKYAAQQLRGTSFLWWEQYSAALPAGQCMRWADFKAAFKAHHIPEGLIEKKLNEFLALTQDTRTVLQYYRDFNNLCLYAGYHTDTDAKKMDLFRRGLSAKLQDRCWHSLALLFMVT